MEYKKIYAAVEKLRLFVWEIRIKTKMLTEREFEKILKESDEETRKYLLLFRYC